MGVKRRMGKKKKEINLTSQRVCAEKKEDNYMFKTAWKPSDAAGEIEKIVKSQALPHNVHQRVSVAEESDGSFTIKADSIKGAWHNPGITINVDPSRSSRGSVVTVVPDSNTSSDEANRIEAKLNEEYFK
jgi:hypothetical protein